MPKPVKRKVLFQSVKSLIAQAQQAVVRNVNTTMLLTYFEIGRMIVEDEQNGKGRADYAKEVLITLSNDLTAEFGRGYSVSNLEYMVGFYKNYQTRLYPASPLEIKRLTNADAEKSQTVSGKLKKNEDQISQTVSGIFKFPFELTWSHYIQLLRIKNEEERNFYEIESVQNNWSVRELQRQYSSSVYERLALSRNKEKVKQLSKRGQIIEQTTDALKSHYVLEFLGLKEEEAYSENDLETAIINKLEHFMLELGKGFLFEGRQRRFTFEGDSFFVDLVFYNRLLKCFVIIDLKIGKLTHQDIGQMQMYVNYYDRKVKQPKENKTIGIILCKEENKAVVEFTLPEKNKQIFAKEYKAILPSKASLAKQLL
jgi:predicted nuclease of restriction endonuclease-like (RecB) superfamily